MNPQKIELILDIVTVVCTVFIIGFAIGSRVYIARQNKNNLLIAKRRWIEMLPSITSTLGVLGTFAGITVGLCFFNTHNLNTSIPLLLSGLKTAFFTSLAGMVCSLLLSRYVTSLYDKQDKGVSDINIAAGQITASVQTMATNTTNLFNQVNSSLTQLFNIQNAFFNSVKASVSSIQATLGNNIGPVKTSCSNIPAMYSGIQSITANVAEIKRFRQQLDAMSQLLKQQRLDIASSKATLDNIVISVGNIEDDSKSIADNSTSIKNNTDSIDTNIGEIATSSEATAGTEDSILTETKKFSNLISDEVDDIEKKMGETNTLLTKKFDEFSELLKKSNTEALVEVMKRLTEDFQKQMNALITRLVQENFEQLNKSVERLNTWQQENKAQISALITQYKNMEHDFENSSTTLSKVSTDTKSLVSDGGKLDQLINSLNKVLLEDKSYVEITKSLQSAANLTKDNMQKFDGSVNHLNEWIRKQRNFAESVNLLITKLEDLRKIKDYGEEFWKGTKKNMEEGVGIIKNGSTELEKQLQNLDSRFYERLSSTLASLDACIQAMINSANQNTPQF